MHCVLPYVSLVSPGNVCTYRLHSFSITSVRILVVISHIPWFHLCVCTETPVVFIVTLLCYSCIPLELRFLAMLKLLLLTLYLQLSNHGFCWGCSHVHTLVLAPTFRQNTPLLLSNEFPYLRLPDFIAW